jgi:hypothetical protein
MIGLVNARHPQVEVYCRQTVIQYDLDVVKGKNPKNMF